MYFKDVHYLLKLHIRESIACNFETGETIQYLERLILTFVKREIDNAYHKYDSKEAMLVRLQGLVELHLNAPWTIESLSSSLHISGIYLIQLCKKYWHTTPLRMVNRLRMERARQLLAGTDYPLKKIADMVGYSSAQSLSHAFKRYFGTNPREFRKEQFKPKLRRSK
jgi:AraC-like DNA-binding protein